MEKEREMPVLLAHRSEGNHAPKTPVERFFSVFAVMYCCAGDALRCVALGWSTRAEVLI